MRERVFDPICGEGYRGSRSQQPLGENNVSTDQMQSTSRNPNEGTLQIPLPASASALLRHFADLRDGTHGGARSRKDKEALFAAAVPLLDPHARQALEENNASLLLGTG